MKKNYDAIDLMKFIAAIFIIGIHSSALRDISPVLNDVIFQGIGRLGFPLFFVASGFLLSKKIQSDTKNTKIIVKNYVKRIGIVYLFWLAFNWKWVWESWFANSTGTFESNFVKLCLDIVFQSTFSGSWYLMSCIFSAILYFIVLKRLSRTQKLILTGIIFFVVATFSLRINNPIINYIKNVLYLPVSIFVGPIYFAIGDLIANDDVRTIKENQNVYIIGTLLSAILWIIELIMKSKILISTDQLFIYPIISYFIFSLLLTVEIKIPFSYEMRKISSVMYLSQFSFLFLNQAFLNLPSTVLFSLTVIETITLGMVVLKLNKLKEFDWLSLAY
ncbi:acyltransferase family protein [Companilactobacillus sp. DQM5]|uniref:acyltransferase family protein n=1 Tax=Companilactobacillus sp. DQM5 TaxID=3463359 RepID=UPI004059D7C2